MGSARANALQGVDRYFYLRCHEHASEAELRPIYALRYAIYCEECGFLPSEDYPDQLESDEYDVHSALFSAVNEGEEVVGTSRLVLGREVEQQLPFVSHCPPNADFEFPPAAESAEISRLAVHSNYRRRKGDTLFGVNEEELKREPGEKDAASGERRANAPLLVLGLYREMYCYSKANDIRYWYAAMEASLARVLSHFGFKFTVIGPRQDYYGPVRPYLGDLRKLEKELAESSPEMLAWFQSPL